MANVVIQRSFRDLLLEPRLTIVRYLIYNVRQIQAFLHMLESGRFKLPYTLVDCVVCKKFPTHYWAVYETEYDKRGLHCEKCKYLYHAVVDKTWGCCDPHYHPAKYYAWRQFVY
jgi:hypothetical protein